MTRCDRVMKRLDVYGQVLVPVAVFVCGSWMEWGLTVAAGAAIAAGVIAAVLGARPPGRWTE